MTTRQSQKTSTLRSVLFSLLSATSIASLAACSADAPTTTSLVPGSESFTVAEAPSQQPVDAVTFYYDGVPNSVTINDIGVLFSATILGTNSVSEIVAYSNDVLGIPISNEDVFGLGAPLDDAISDFTDDGDVDIDDVAVLLAVALTGGVPADANLVNQFLASTLGLSATVSQSDLDAFFAPLPPVSSIVDESLDVFSDDLGNPFQTFTTHTVNTGALVPLDPDEYTVGFYSGVGDIRPVLSYDLRNLPDNIQVLQAEFVTFLPPIVPDFLGLGQPAPFNLANNNIIAEQVEFTSPINSATFFLPGTTLGVLSDQGQNVPPFFSGQERLDVTGAVQNVLDNPVSPTISPNNLFQIRLRAQREVFNGTASGEFRPIGLPGEGKFNDFTVSIAANDLSDLFNVDQFDIAELTTGALPDEVADLLADFVDALPPFSQDETADIAQSLSETPTPNEFGAISSFFIDENALLGQPEPNFANLDELRSLNPIGLAASPTSALRVDITEATPGDFRLILDGPITITAGGDDGDFGDLAEDELVGLDDFLQTYASLQAPGLAQDIALQALAEFNADGDIFDFVNDVLTQQTLGNAPFAVGIGATSLTITLPGVGNGNVIIEIPFSFLALEIDLVLDFDVIDLGRVVVSLPDGTVIEATDARELFARAVYNGANLRVRYTTGLQ